MPRKFLALPCLEATAQRAGHRRQAFRVRTVLPVNLEARPIKLNAQCLLEDSARMEAPILMKARSVPSGSIAKANRLPRSRVQLNRVTTVRKVHCRRKVWTVRRVLLAREAVPTKSFASPLRASIVRWPVCRCPASSAQSAAIVLTRRVGLRVLALCRRLKKYRMRPSSHVLARPAATALQVRVLPQEFIALPAIGVREGQTISRHAQLLQGGRAARAHLQLRESCARLVLPVQVVRQ